MRGGGRAGRLGVEWLRYGDQYGVRRMPPPRSLANLKKEIAEKKRAEVRSWAEDKPEEESTG